MKPHWTIRYVPQREKVEEDGGESHSSETYDGEEWNADVENILQALDETGKRPQKLLNVVNRVLYFLQGAFLIILNLEIVRVKSSRYKKVHLSDHLWFLQFLGARAPAPGQYFVTDLSGQHNGQSKGNHPELEKPGSEDEDNQERQTSSFVLPVDNLPRGEE